MEAIDRHEVVAARVRRCGCWEFRVPQGDAVMACAAHRAIHGVRTVQLREERWVWI